MKRFLTCMLAASAFLGLALSLDVSPAAATTIQSVCNPTCPDLGTSPSDGGQLTEVRDLHIGFFADEFDFTAGGDTLTFTLAKAGVFHIFDFYITDGMGQPLTENVIGGVPGLLTTGFFTAAATVFTYSNLVAGSQYMLFVTGRACSCAAYAFSLASSVTTPISPALLMFMTALGSMGVIGWRRRKTLSA